MLNNTIFAPGGAWPYSIEARFAESTNILIQNNLSDEPIWGSRDGASSILVTNITNASAGDFVDIGIGDLHLASASLTAVGTATAHVDRVGDIDRQAILDEAPDIGADEFYLRGDVNVDGVVDLTDLALVLEVLSGQVRLNTHAEADVNDDGAIGPADALYILQAIETLR